MPPRKRAATEAEGERTQTTRRDGEEEKEARGRSVKRSRREEEEELEAEAKEVEDDVSKSRRKKGKGKASSSFVTASSLVRRGSSSSNEEEGGRYPLRRSAGRTTQSTLAAYVPQPWTRRQSAPRVEVNPREGPNFLFYSAVRPSRPNGDLIDRIHRLWWGDYRKLEVHHGYIQWLFPLFEGGGMNHLSSRLTKGEAKLMRESIQIAMRVVKSYQMMLDFYGLRLVDKKTGQIKRTKQWLSRYRNLNSYTHNNLRITRILTSLGHLGFARWKKPLVDFFKREILEKGHLRACRTALLNHWEPTLDVESAVFIKKTGERAEDRTESVYFRYLEQGDIPESEDEDAGDYDDEEIPSDSESEKESKAKSNKGKGKAKPSKKDDEPERKPRFARRRSKGN